MRSSNMCPTSHSPGPSASACSPGVHDWPPGYPLIFGAVNQLKVRSCLIDAETNCSMTTARRLSSQRDDTGRLKSSFRSATNPLDAIAPSTGARRSGPDSALPIGPMQNRQLHS